MGDEADLALLTRRTLRQVLLPLARIMVARGITIADANEILKEVLFDVARDLSGEGPKTSDSRVSLLTGLHRKDVGRLRKAKSGARRKSSMNAAAKVIALWTTDRSFLDGKGAARALPRVSDTRPGFDELVERARVDLPAGTIVTHLVDQKLVTESRDKRLKLRTDAYLPVPGSAEMLVAFEKNVSAHLDAAAGNLLSERAPPFFERASHFNRLSEKSVRELEALARRLGSEALRRFNEEAMALQRQDVEDETNTGRVSLGVYVLPRHKAAPKKEAKK